MSDLDVLVVGAGLAGLSAARSLHMEGLSVAVWEARDRVGGRTLTRDVGGASVDLGAQWLGPTQVRMHELARELGLHTFDTYDTGKAVLIDGDDRKVYRGTVPLLGPVQLGRMGLTLRAMTKMAAAVGPLGGRDLAAATDLDARTAADVLGDTLGGDGSARRVVDAALRVIFGAEPEELSAAWVAAYAAAAGGDLLGLAAVEGGAQQTRLVEGTQAFSVRMAAALDVTLNRPVAAIRQTSGKVVVTGRDGTAATAGRVVMAIPTPLTAGIHFDPLLPHVRRAAQQRMPMGATSKVFAFYDEPFWRDEGLKGEAVLTDGPVQVAFDNTSHDGEVPALLAFITGAAAHDAAGLPDDQVEEAVRVSLGRAFGPRATTPQMMIAQHWQRERYTGGCPVANLTPGSMVPFGAALREGVGRIHWAGTESSRDWTGYMEGAVASGRRAASEILAAGTA